jgi:hypothetical protein
MTKTITALKKGEPKYIHDYYDSFEKGKIRILFIAP